MFLSWLSHKLFKDRCTIDADIDKFEQIPTHIRGKKDTLYQCIFFFAMAVPTTCQIIVDKSGVLETGEQQGGATAPHFC